MNRLRILLLTLAFILAACTSVLQPPTPAPTDAFALNRQLGRGLNLGNALEAPSYEGEWGLRLQDEYFALIAEAGFTSVRVPIRWSAHALKEKPYTIDADFFERIDWVVQQAGENGLLVILNMHHYEEMMVEPELAKPRFLALWQQIAERYQHQPESVLFELLNEPNGVLNAETWNEILPEAIALIRQSNPTRAIIVGPANWNNVYGLTTLKLPADDRHLIATFHYYDPFQFTHQGAEWVTGADAWLGTTWSGTTAQQADIVNAFEQAAAWAKRTHRPLFLGEFGAYSRADIESRAAWTTFVAREAEKQGFSWAYWEFGAGFGVYDRSRGEWNTPLLQALMPQ